MTHERCVNVFNTKVLVKTFVSYIKMNGIDSRKFELKVKSIKFFLRKFRINDS